MSDVPPTGHRAVLETFVVVATGRRVLFTASGLRPETQLSAQSTMHRVAPTTKIYWHKKSIVLTLGKLCFRQRLLPSERGNISKPTSHLCSEDELRTFPGS